MGTPRGGVEDSKQNEDKGIGVKICERHISVSPSQYSWRVAGREKERAARKRFPRGKEVVHLLDMEQSGKEEEEGQASSS